MESWKIKDCEVEYYDDEHMYLVNGVIVPSITQLLKRRFGGKYDGVNSAVLNKAAEEGTKVHKAIELYCKDGEESDIEELRNFKFLKKRYSFDVLNNEVPIVLFNDDEPIAAGRLDMVLKMGDDIGLADIKRTSVLDKEYVGLQLNLYRLAYQQCYGTEITILKAIHLREDKRKFVDIPINEPYTLDFIKEIKNE